VGDSHGCAIQAGTGHVVCWGDDHSGQATPPDAVNGVSGSATDISAGDEHTLAIVALPPNRPHRGPIPPGSPSSTSQ
jgi:hypothetical protein